jgi:hypothetical protein
VTFRRRRVEMRLVLPGVAIRNESSRCDPQHLVFGERQPRTAARKAVVLDPRKQLRERDGLSAGGKEIRTLGPPQDRRHSQTALLASAALPVPPERPIHSARGTKNSNLLPSASESNDDRAVALYQNGPMSYSSISLFVWSLSLSNTQRELVVSRGGSCTVPACLVRRP